MTIGKIYFVTVSLDYNTSPMNQPKLLGTTEDSASMVKLMRGYTDSIYVLTNAQATESNLRAVLAEATQDPNGFLVFHYSGHGIKSNVTGKEGICLYDKIMYDTDFWEAVKNGSCRKVMTIFAACYSGGIIPAEGGLRLMSAAEDRPRGGFFQEAAKSVFAPRRSSRLMAASASSDTGFSVLCWSPCSADELSYMMPARAEHPGLQYYIYQSADDASKGNRIKYGTVYGHEFIGRICGVFDPKLTYEQLWNKIGAEYCTYGYKSRTTSKTYQYENWQDTLVHRQKTVIGASFESEMVFSEASSGGGGDQPSVRQYTIQFKDYDNTTIKICTVDEGALPSPPANPTRPGYDFTGWSPPLAAVQSDAVYVAQYAKSQATADPAPISNPVVLESEITTRSGAAIREVSDIYWKNPPSPAPKIYGYVTPTAGPGDSCFQDVLDGAKRGGWPVVMVLDCGAKAGSDFAADCNDGTDFEGDRYLLQWINLTVRQELKAGLCYFRGNNQSPKAYDDARKFATQNGIDVSTGLTLVGFIYDGEKFVIKGEALPASVVRYKARTEAMIKALDVKRPSPSALKPRRLAPRKDVFDPNKVRYDYTKNLYNAGDTSRNLSVEIGVWNGNLQKTLEVADAENVPVLVIFGVGNCYSHWNQLWSDQFQNWQLSCNMYLSYCYGSWKHGGYSENWLTSKTQQAYPVENGKYIYSCPEYAVHWKSADGKELNIGKYLSRNGDSTGLYLEPYTIEGVLSGYFSQYQSISYDNVSIRKDNQEDFSVIGRGTIRRTDNALANKTNYRVSVPYKNLENIKAFSEKYDIPLIAIYFNSAVPAAGAGNGLNLRAAFNIDTGFDEWIKLEDTAIIWADVADTDGGKAAAGGEQHTWIADLGAHPERSGDKWAFRFYSKQHGVDKSYSFKEIYDQVYDSNKAKATENLKNFIYTAFAAYYNDEVVSKPEDAELFIVEYMDYDGQRLIPQQTVFRGQDAQPPQDPPVRSGYTFIGYMPTGQNVNSDLTCVAQYKATGGAPGYFLQHTYDPGSYALRISNNLCAIQVIGDMRDNGMATQLTSVQFQDNLFEIMPSCFMNCAQLRTVDIKNKTRWIGDYAFYGCSQLESVNALTYPKQTQVNTIGAHSFQNTGLTDVAIDLTAAQYSAGVGEYAFAGCKELRSAKIVHSSYVGRSAFENCTALTSVTFPDSGCYSYPEAFAGCAALPSISIPHNVQSLNDGLFKDCAALTSVTIRDSAQAPSELDYVGPDIFNGCRNLTSITLPPSITSIMQLDQNFLRGSAIREITFNGLSDDVFQSGYVESRTTKIQGYITNEQQFYTAAKDALARNIPIVMITMENSPHVDLNSPDCPRCRALAAQLLSQDWQSYMNSNRSKCYFVLAQLNQNQQLFNVVSNPSYSSVPLFQGAYSFGSSWTLYSKVVVYYRDISGKAQVRRKGWPSVEDDKTAADPGKLREFVDAIVSKANNPVQDESRLSAMISKLGSPLDYIVAYSKTGREYRLSSDSNVDAYTPPVVDTDTVSGFKTGIWYYNAKELKQYADENSLPVFVEYSDRWCPSCIKFRNEIYGRSEFQEWVAKQPYLFCRIETEYYDEFNRMFTQPYFVRNTWAKNASITLPGMVFYWNREQNPVWDVVGYGDDPIGYVELQDMISRKFKT